MDMEKYHCIYLRNGIQLKSIDAPSLDDATELLDKNGRGEELILTDKELKTLFFMLLKDLGVPRYTKTELKELERGINFAIKHGELSEEQGKDLITDLDEGFKWLNSAP